jgi:hypothetical protein
MKAHRPWQPHLDRDPLFNPFVPTTVRPLVDAHVEQVTPDESEESEEQAFDSTPEQADVQKD